MKRRPIQVKHNGPLRPTGLLRSLLVLSLAFFLSVLSELSAQEFQNNQGFENSIATPATNDALFASSIKFPQPDASFGVDVDALQATQWRQGSWDVFHLNGQVKLQQGTVMMSADQTIIWVDREPAPNSPASILVYCEGNVVVDVGHQGPEHVSTGSPTTRYVDSVWFGRLRTNSQVQFRPLVQEISADNAPPIFQRGMAHRQSELDSILAVQYATPTTVVSPVTGQVQQVLTPVPQTFPQQTFPQQAIPQVQSPGFGITAPTAAPIAPVGPRPQLSGGTATTDVNFFANDPSRSNFRRIRGNNPDEWVYVYTGSTRITVDSTELAQVEQLGQPSTSRLVIQADNVVAWQNPLLNADGTSGSRWELYMEGNIVFAQGERVIYADRMYYDATSRRGTILNADVLTPVPSYQGLLRMKADVVQQLDDNNLQAYNAAITSSRLGVPRYWLQSDQLNVTRVPKQGFDPLTGIPNINPATGQPETGDDYFIQSNDNRLYIAGVPVFYWPTLNTDLNDPNYYIERLRLGNDSVLGTQLGVGLDLFQLFGIRNRPVNGRWIGNLDYLSERGFGFGTDGDYRTNSFLGYAGQTDGYFRSWFIDDRGLDNLGLDRRAVPLEEDFRGRALWRHRQTFLPGYQVRAEFGFLSDQNFLQQFFEREWDQDKDYNTGVWLERNVANQSYNLTADVQVNDFFTQTSWLPRFDHFILGQPIFFDRAVWHGRSSAGYARFRTADAPTNAIDLAKFDPLAWEGVDVEGAVAGTRQQIDFPIQLGALKAVPYVLGDASYWQEDLNGEDLFRVYGQAGIRTSLPMWRIDPTIHSTLFNLNGLAHKVTWENEFLYADASQDLDRLPLYNQLDDDAQEFFRRRFAFDTFGIAPGGDTPLQFDERFFALRSGIQSNVTSPVSEIADDLTLFRTGVRNRWQTKRGLPGEARIVDWITFDVHYNFYPDADRDNFGSDFGMLDYDFRWHIGDRFSVVSDGYFDFFGQGLRTASIGAHMSRPGLGNLFVGFRTIEGPISSNVLSAAATYRMSDKWIARGSSSVDFSDAGNIGQSLSFVRIGESFLVSFGVRADISRDNVGFVLGVEPRFLPSGRLGLVGGQRIAPASSEFIE